MVSNAKSDEVALKCLQECRNYQIMIDASCNHLHKLRVPTISKSGHFAPTSGTIEYFGTTGESGLRIRGPSP